MITPFYPNLEIPQQIVHLNGNEQDCSLKNLVPLWTQEEMLEYWVLRLKEELQMDVKVADFGVCNESTQDYLVTEAGELFSIRSQTWLVCPFRGNYRVFGFSIENTRQKNGLLHRLVCYTFNGHPPSRLQSIVDHIDRDTSNNHRDNLRWVDYSTNNSNRSGTNEHTTPTASRGADWRNIGWIEGKDFSGYEVDSLGMLRKSNKQVMPDHEDHRGYITNSLLCASDNQFHHMRRHRLVASVFCKEQRTDEKNVVDHVNGEKKDNRKVNLKWVSQQENVEFALGQSIIVRKNNVVVNTFPSIDKFKEQYGQSFPNISYQLATDGPSTFRSRDDNQLYEVERENNIQRRTRGQKVAN